jgi:hypothetical protein
MKKLLTINVLGAETGHISNSRRWQKTTPPIFRSPFYCHGDIGKYDILSFLLRTKFTWHKKSRLFCRAPQAVRPISDYRKQF